MALMNAGLSVLILRHVNLNLKIFDRQENRARRADREAQQVNEGVGAVSDEVAECRCEVVPEDIGLSFGPGDIHRFPEWAQTSPLLYRGTVIASVTRVVVTDTSTNAQCDGACYCATWTRLRTRVRHQLGCRL